MPTIIDALVVSLKLDSKPLETAAPAVGRKLKDLENQSVKTSGEVKQLGTTSKSSASGVDTLTRSLASFLALLGGTVAIKAFVSDMIQSSAALDRLSKNLNLSAGEITAWGNAAEELGGTAAGLQGSLSMLSKAQTQIAITGESSLVPYFNFLGVSLADASGHALKTTDVLAQLATVAEGKDRRTMHNIFTEMGFDEGTINLILAGRKELDLSLRKQKEYAEQVKKFAPEATKMQRALVDIKQQFTLLGLSLLNQAAPALEKVLGVFSSFGSWIQNNMEFIKDLGKVLGAIGVGLGVIAIATSPISLVVAGVLALAAAIALLWQDYQTWQRGGDSLIDWSKWKPGIDAAAAGIQELKKIAVSAFDAIATAATVAQDVIHGDWHAAKDALVKGTVKMNKVMGIAGPDESHDQGGRVLNHVAKRIISDRTGLAKPNAGLSDIAPGHKTLGEAIAQVEGFYAKGKKPNRPQRNHNPGDIEYGKFAKDHGATGTDGRFAIFPDDETGNKALYALLQRSDYANLTIPEAVNKFAPPNENNTKGYIDSVLKQTGLTATTTVSQALNGTPGASSVLNGIPGASSTVAQAGQRGATSSTTNDNRVSNHVGSVTIQAPAGDANSIARAFRSGLDGLFPAVAVVGLR